jgi:hypothetical protein
MSPYPNLLPRGEGGRLQWGVASGYLRSQATLAHDRLPLPLGEGRGEGFLPTLPFLAFM